MVVPLLFFKKRIKIPRVGYRKYGPRYDFDPYTDPLQFALDRWSRMLLGHREWFEERYGQVLVPKLPSPAVAELSDFALLKTIAYGRFSKVMVVQHKRTRKILAMKIYKREDVDKNHMAEYVCRERRILDTVCFPYIPFMFHHFKDNANLYITMEFVDCGSIAHYLKRCRAFPEKFVIFYSAQVILALDYLHSNDIIHRDVRPENIVFDSQGYIKLCDLGYAKRCRKHNEGRLWSLIGSIEYLAPGNEMIKGVGYNRAVDYYAVGILIYEMLSGQLPFVDFHPRKVYEKILFQHYLFPRHFSFLARRIIRHLTHLDLAKRIGNTWMGSQVVKRNAWFAHLNWEGLLLKKYHPFGIIGLLKLHYSPLYDELVEEPLVTSRTELYAEEFENF